jgi:hypothetical protein
MLTIKYPNWRLWADYFIYFYDYDVIDGMGNHPVVCILDIRTDELVDDYRK